MRCARDRTLVVRHLSFVLLPRPYDADGPAIVDAHARLFPRAARPLASSSESQVAELRDRDGLTTHVAMMPAAIPTGEAEEAASFSLASFSTKFGELAPHAAHLIVTTHGETPSLAPVDTLARHTRIVAACAVAYDAVGIYEGNARATHPVAFYVNVATSSERPIMLWSGVSIAREDDGRTSLLTLGMENMLGVPDVLIRASPGKGNDALAFAFDLLGYVISRGEALPDGDTIGGSADERLLVRYVASPIHPERRVVSIDLP